MQHVKMYSTAICPYCLMAEKLLSAKGVTTIEKLRVDLEPHLLEEMMASTQRRTVPQIFIGDLHVGGFDDLQQLEHSGELEAILNRPSGQG